MRVSEWHRSKMSGLPHIGRARMIKNGLLSDFLDASITACCRICARCAYPRLKLPLKSAPSWQWRSCLVVE